jgi:Ca2+:H+ antiporter
MPLSEDGAGPSALEEAPAEEQMKDPSHDSGTGTSQTVVAEEKPRPFIKRVRKRLPFLKHKGNDNTDVERTTTSESEKPKQKFTAMGQLRATILNSYINILLIAVPVGIAVNYAKISPVVVFVVNFIAIVPLAALLSYATEEIALRTGETIGGLLNATFG